MTASDIVQTDGDNAKDKAARFRRVQAGRKAHAVRGAFLILIGYAICLLIGALAGTVGGMSFASPSTKDVAIIQSGQLQASYWLIASPRQDVLPDEQIAVNARAALALQLINTAPLYSALAYDRDRATLASINADPLPCLESSLRHPVAASVSVP